MFTSRDVSVVVPVYGPPLHFMEALRSVASQRPGELIVVDDHSPKRLPDLSEFPDIQVVRHAANRGPGAARNTGIRQATRPWVTFIDADDLWIEGRLELQLGLAKEHGSDVIFGVTSFVGADGGPDPRRRESRHTPCMASLLVRRELALRFPQDEVHRTSEDLDFYLKLKEAKVSMTRHDDPVLKYRKHDSSLTSGQSEEERKSDLARVLTQVLARRRAQATQETR